MQDQLGFEEIRLEPFSTFPRSFPHSTSKGVYYWGQGGTLIALFEPCEDPNRPGKLLFSLEIIHDGEVFTTSDISWNQKDELEIAHGEDWLVKLTNYNYEEEWQ